MKCRRLISKKNIQLPEVLLHIFGPDNTYYFMVAQKFYLESKIEEFKMPINSVKSEYGLSRHKQLAALEYLTKNGFIFVKNADDGILQDGKSYRFDQEAIATLNYLISLTEEVKNFKGRLNSKMIKNNLNVDEIIKKVEKV